MPAIDHTPRLALINFLADGEFHSGEELGQQLGMSRAGISKHIKVIQDWGLDVYKLQGKGYRLAAPLDLLNEDRLREQTDSPSVCLQPIIDSTNQYLMNRIGELDSGSVCLAEYQQAGRGRRGRQWFSPFGANLYTSMYWRLEAGMAAAMGMSLVVGISVAKTLNRLGADGVKVKWPNDIYWQDKKLAGVLVEMTGQAGGAAHLVVGLGLNVSMRDKEGGQLDQPWTRLEDACEALPDKNQLAAALINDLISALRQYEQHGLGMFIEQWQALDNYYNRPVKLLIGESVIRGIARGIDAQGAILLETEKGLVPFVGGEISLRGEG
ncbi:bifunctional biotin--[acetyl-CoA-carboxylase] ligase/biotin operon repressor BirA [Veronia pacifica]|uniref:Bifunctional ligase/repressor BirA n=1 Tax=Veronia pacifica TaxID=1080227 RepID=A0A1C3E6Z5_9GAMM|nr:bifunctional biotin--[acetyl-CoA-carboxylase] ligase/biotin operon repressor BirA [Veronia pacifica]ODA29027.1 biotin--[acetyl-CoA-carboxylase] ligase [Veronia pacifica]